MSNEASKPRRERRSITGLLYSNMLIPKYVSSARNVDSLTASENWAARARIYTTGHGGDAITNTCSCSNRGRR